VCADCRKLPMAEQQRRLAMDEILGFLEQSNISAKNIVRVKELVSIADPRFQVLRELILEIALVKPHKRRRWKFLREHRLDLLQRAVDAGLVEELVEPIEPDRDDSESEMSAGDAPVPPWDDTAFVDNLPIRNDVPF